jgi:hypothetical protein
MTVDVTISFSLLNERNRNYDDLREAMDENFADLIKRHDALISEAVELFHAARQRDDGKTKDETVKRAMARGEFANLIKQLMKVNFPDGFKDLFPNDDVR